MVDPELDDLKREFLAEAGEKVREMQASLSNTRDADSIHRLGYLAHQLKGSGGSYGYQTISAEAAEIEKAVESASTGIDPGVATKIRERVSRLESEIGDRARELAR